MDTMSMEMHMLIFSPKVVGHLKPSPLPVCWRACSTMRPYTATMAMAHAL